MKDGDLGYQIPAELIARENRDRADDLDRDYDGLREGLRRAGVLARLGLDLDQLTEQVSRFEAAIPTSSIAGGDASGRLPSPGAPAGVLERLVDAKTVHTLCGATPRVVLHFPSDRLDDPMELRELARRLELGIVSVSTEASPAVRSGHRPGAGAEAEQVSAAIEFGRAVGSEGITVGIGDGGDFPGQVHFRRSLDRTIDGLREVCAALPEGWRLLLAPRTFEPPGRAAAADWGTALVAARALGERATCQIDLGAPSGVRPELAAARLIALGKLGGIQLGEAGPAGRSLTAGSVDPYRLFLLFCELADAENDPEIGKEFVRPAITLGPGSSLKDPIEDVLQSVEAALLAHTKALLVDRPALARVQDRGDAASAEGVLKRAFETDVRPVLRMARVRKGAAADPLETYRGARYREEKVRERKTEPPGGGRIG